MQTEKFRHGPADGKHEDTFLLKLKATTLKQYTEKWLWVDEYCMSGGCQAKSECQTNGALCGAFFPPRHFQTLFKMSSM